MSVHVIDRVWMVGDHTAHQARRVADDRWVVSYLRGRMLSTEQATAAIQAADAAAWVEDLARHMGLTALEAIGLAVTESPWEIGPHRRRKRFTRPPGRHRR
ncbi:MULTISPECIES: hypothetical protein [Nocardia]|uniref:Uncharacterized protein n=1 Tax=Nocardia arthritidis TaxID=228602 RepID=A0A6G9YS85_9NOCA|nr:MULTISPECIES: hypothetical protein [Nocardia]QIS16175.1 hypothetical protein F5544_41825 [Nocardia arthritidis]